MDDDFKDPRETVVSCVMFFYFSHIWSRPIIFDESRKLTSSLALVNMTPFQQLNSALLGLFLLSHGGDAFVPQKLALERTVSSSLSMVCCVQRVSVGFQVEWKESLIGGPGDG